MTFQVANTAHAEGSRSLFPLGYFSGETDNVNASATRTSLSYGSDTYLGKIRQANFFYVYARANEYILVGTSGARSAVRLFAAPGPGQTLQERFGDPGLENPATIGSTLTLTGCGVGTANITTRALELAGPQSQDGTGNPTGFVPCYYQAPSDGIYGVAISNVNATVQMWDISVRANASSATDLNGRVFTYALSGDTASPTNPTYATHYYVTSDGYRYSQTMRGLAPYRYVLYSNPQGFLDVNGNPLYKDVRGQTNIISSIRPAGTGIDPQGPTYPMFFSDVSAGSVDTVDGLQATLGALGIPVTPNDPQVLSTSFTYTYTGGSSTYVGQGGVFTVSTQDALTYQIVIKGGNTPAHDDPGHPDNRVLTGIASGLNQQVVWDGMTNSGTPMPAGSGYRFEVTGRAGEVHFPFLDAEGNLNGGPTVTRLNGIGFPESTVYYDDRGYTTNGIDVGTPGGHICGPTAGGAPSPNYSLLGVDSSNPNLGGSGHYYRYWGEAPYTGNPNADCSANGYFGDAKGMDLWTFIKDEPPAGTFELTILSSADVAANVSVPASVAPGATGLIVASFGNVGSLAAAGTAYTIQMPTNLSGVSCTGATCSYNAATGLVTITGLPGSLSPSQWTNNVTLQYTAPASGSVPVTATVTTSSSQPVAPALSAPDSDSGTATVAAGGTTADVLAIVAPPAAVAPGDDVTATVTFRNLGPVTATGVTYSMTLPSGLTGVSCVAPANCTYDSATGAISVTGLANSLSAGDSVPVTLSYTAPSSGAVQLTATVNTAISESDSTNNTDSATTIVSATANADVTASVAPPASAIGGSTVNVPVTFRNLGPAAAANMSYTIALTPGTSGVSCSAPVTCSYDAGTGYLTPTAGVPALLASGTEVAIVVTYTAPASGIVDFGALVSTSTIDSNITNNTANAQTTIIPNTYTVSFDSNGGSAVADIDNVTHGATISAPTPPTRLGYTFLGWYKDAGFADDWEFATDTVTGPTTLYAGWALTQYSLAYTAGANGSITGTTPQIVTHGGNGTAVTATASTGYHFVSWSDGLTTATRTDTNITSNLSVTATFAINQYTLTYTAGANGSITGTTPQTVNHGANGTAVAGTPATGYHFVSWSDGITTATRTETNVTSNHSVTATFAINQYTLTYTAGANGSITGTTPQTVNHGSNASAVTAVPATGYHFVSWSDGVTTATRTDTNVTINRAATATFAINQYTLTYAAGANGSITGATPQTVNHGANGSAVTAVPASGYHFVSWSDGITTATRTETNVTANHSAVATFAINQYTVTYTAGANGSITGVTPQTVNHGANGSAVTAVPAAGYHFGSWSDGNTTAARAETNVTSNRSFTATFSINQYTLTYTAGANGSITGTTPQGVNHGGNGTAVTAVPAPGYHFVSWSDGGTTATRTDTNITSSRALTATFAVDQYTLTYTAGANGAISGTTPQSVNHGGSGSAVTAVPAPGYSFSSWSDGVTTATRTDTNVTSNRSVTATFVLNQYTLTYTAGANGSITGTTPQTVNHGGNGSAVTAVPASGYRFVSWSDGVTNAARTDLDVQSDLTVTANFALGSVATEEHIVEQGGEHDFQPPAGSTLSNFRRIRGGQQTSIDNPAPADYADVLECSGTTCTFLGKRSGRYELTYTDTNGATTIFAFVVHPNVGYAIERQSGRQGTPVTVRVVLDDLPVAEEVRIAYSIDNAAAVGSPQPSDLLTRNPQTLVFNVGPSGNVTCFDAGHCETEITFTPTVPTGDVQFHLHDSEGVVVGDYQTHTVSIVPVTMVPVTAELVLLPGHTVTAGTPVTAGVIGLPPGNYSFDWSASESALGIGSQTTDATTPVSTTAGNYAIHVTVRDLDNPNRPAITLNSWLRVVTDAQSNSVCGSQGCDDDGTRIPVAQQAPQCALGVNDPGNAIPYRLQVGERNSSWDTAELCLETSPGYGMRLGTVSFLSSPSYGAGIDAPSVRDYGNNGREATNATDYTHTHSGLHYDFEVTGLVNAGASTAVVVPLPRNLALPADAVWRKFDAANGWATFVVDAANAIHSAASIGGQCPSPVSPLWDANPGLVAGLECVRLVIQDGGPNDADRQTNGVIAKTGALAVKAGGHKITSSDKKGGGGAMDPLWLLLIGAMVAWRARRTRAAIALLSIVMGVSAAQAADTQADEQDEIRSRGWFLGATGALAMGEVGSEEVTRGLNDLGIGLTARVEDEDRFAWRGFGGYRFGKYLSLEAGYTNLGVVTTYVDGNPVDLYDIPHVLPASGAGPELSVSGYLPISERLDLYARLGLWHWETLYHVHESGQKRRPKASDTDVLGGIGARYWLSRHWQAGLSYDRYRIDEQDVDLLGLNVVYHFGSKREKQLEPALPIATTPAPAPVAAAPPVVAPAPVAPPPAPAPAPAPTPAAPPVFLVNFGFDSAAVNSEATGIIAEAAEYLTSHRDLNVEVTGHTDLRGSDRYNLNLSMRRAQAVADALIARGVARERIKASARGLREPLSGELDDKARAADRRVHITPVQR